MSEDIKQKVKTALERLDSIDRVYDFFKQLGYSDSAQTKFYDKSYKTGLSLPAEEKEKIESIHSIFSFGKRNGVFKAEISAYFIKTKTVSNSIIKAISKEYVDRGEKVLVVLTPNYKQYVFLLPEAVPTEDLKNKIKYTKLFVDLKLPAFMIRLLTKLYVGSTINKIIGGTTNAKRSQNYTHFRS